MEGSMILMLILHITLFFVLVGGCVFLAWKQKPLWLLSFAAGLLIQLISLVGSA